MAAQGDDSGSVKPAFTAKLVKMWRTGRGCDVSIRCKDNETAKAHSVVLSSISDKLEELLDEADTIVTEDIEINIWNALLECVYTGLYDPQLNLGQVSAIIELAEQYEIEAVVPQLQEIIRSKSEKKDSTDVDKSETLVESMEESEAVQATDVTSEVTEPCETIPDKDMKSKTEEESAPNDDGGCIRCGKDCTCTASIVRCFLCFRKVPADDMDHMTTEHPFTPDSSKWPFSCEAEEGETAASSEAEVLFIKENSDGSAKLTEATSVLVEAKSNSSVQYRCMHCNDTFSELHNVKDHAEETHQVTPKVCTVCQMGFKGSRELLDHEHYCMGGSAHTCSICHKKVGLFASLSQHMMTHNQEDPEGNEELPVVQGDNADVEGVDVDMKPVVTKKASNSIGELVIEGEPTTEDNSKVTPTTEDGYLLVTPVDQLRNEICLLCHDQCTANKVLCLLCFQVVPDKKMHKSSMHWYTPETGVWLYTCNTEQFFPELPADTMMFSKHQIHQVPPTSAQDKGLMFYCSTCKGRFASMEKLCGHIVSQFKCSLCSSFFTSLKLVADHLEEKHSKPGMFVCSTCNSGFLDDKLCKEHKFYCSGGKPRACDKCKVVSWRTEDLKTHMKSHLKDKDKAKKRVEGSVQQAGVPEQDEHVEEGGEGDEVESSIRKVRVACLKVDRKEMYKKMCVRCGESCISVEVKCRYCYQTVESGKRLEHMKKEHPLTPCTSLWPVDCQYYKIKGFHPAVLSSYEFIRMEGDKKKKVSDTITVSKVLCAICFKDQLSSEELKVHLKQVHNIASTSACQQCFTIVNPSWPDLTADHVNLCRGGDFYKCLQCGKLAGSLLSANMHWLKSHPILKSLLSQTKEEEGTCDSSKEVNNVVGEEVVEKKKPAKKKRGRPPSKAAGTTSRTARLLEESSPPQGRLNKYRRLEQKRDNFENVDDKKDLQEVCVTCMQINRPCRAAQVLCLYCFEIVRTSDNHRKQCHPFTPAESIWPYSCNTVLLTGNRGKRIITKEQKHSKDGALSQGQFGAKSTTFDCKVCMAKFSTLEKLLGHITHYYQCCKCKLCFTKLSTITKHMSTQHSFSEVFVCKVCNSGFRSSERMSIHEYFCDQGQIKQCGLCPLRFWKVDDHAEHMESVHNTTPEEDGMDGDEMESFEVGPLEMECLQVKPLETMELEYIEEFQEDEAEGMNISVTNKTKPTKATSKTKAGYLRRGNHSVELIKEELQSYYEEFPIVRNGPHFKVCLTCVDEACEATEVHCGYCYRRVLVTDREVHFNEYHSLIPTSSLWPVKCRRSSRKSIDGLSKDVCVTTAPLVVEGETTKSKEIVSLYRACVLCEDEVNLFQTSEEVIEHLQTVHKVRVIACDQCGMVLRSTCYGFVHDHLHMCRGGEVVRCKLCLKLSGSWISAKYHHFASHTGSILGGDILPVRNIKGMEHATTVGRHGYQIVCIECHGRCSKEGTLVKCRLCGELVEKDDIHMKTRHPYSATKVWFVVCTYQEKNFTNYYMGEKLPPDDGGASGITYHCVKCKEVFNEQKELYEHVDQNHLPGHYEGRYERILKACPTCEALIMVIRHKEFNFTDHVQFCTYGTLLKCDICHAKFGSTSKVMRHQSKCHREPLANEKTCKTKVKQSRQVPAGTLLTCGEECCPFSTEDLSEFRRHMRVEHKYSKKQAVQLCRMCFKSFRMEADRERHEQTVHLAGQRCLCATCGRDFELPSQLHRHIVYHHEGGSQSCIERSRRNRKRRAMCQVCGATFNGNNMLNKHVRMVHEKSLEYRCPICGRCVCSKSKLTVHINKHTGNRPYECEYCPHKDFTRANVKAHIRKAHPELMEEVPAAAASTSLQQYSVAEGDVIKVEEFVEVTDIPFDIMGAV